MTRSRIPSAGPDDPQSRPPQPAETAGPDPVPLDGGAQSEATTLRPTRRRWLRPALSALISLAIVVAVFLPLTVRSYSKKV